MKRLIAVILCLVVIATLIPSYHASGTGPDSSIVENDASDSYTDVCTSFSDIKIKQYYHAGAHFCIEHGILTGTDVGKFSPDVPVTRAMFVMMLYRIATADMDKRPITVTNRFLDVKSNKYYYDAVRWAVQNGITGGTDTYHFSPDKNVTREQLSLFLYRFALYLNSIYENEDVFLRAPCRRIDVSTDGTLDKFPDASDTSSWARNAMIWAVNNKIISGSSESGVVYLRPGRDCTRAMAATIIYRFYLIENVSLGPSFAKIK